MKTYKDRRLKKREPLCALLPPCRWKLVPKPKVISYATATMPSNICKVCKEQIKTVTVDESQSFWGDKLEHLQYRCCSDKCLQRHWEGQRKVNRRTARIRAEWEPPNEQDI